MLRHSQKLLDLDFDDYHQVDYHPRKMAPERGPVLVVYCSDSRVLCDTFGPALKPIQTIVT